MSEKDFKYLNMPDLLGRKAWIAPSNEADSMIQDEGWSQRLSERLFNLIWFFRDNGLLRPGIADDKSKLTDLVLMFSDFTEEGKKFVMTSAPDKWLASFDRNPSKPSSDVTALNRQLAKLRAK